MMPRLLATAIFTLNFLEANAKPWEDGRSLKEYQFKISCDREGLCEREGAPSEGGQLTSEPTAEPTSGGSRWCDLDGDGDCDAEFRLVTNFAVKYALYYVKSRSWQDVLRDAPDAADGVTSPAVVNWRKAYNVIVATRAFEQAGRGA